MMGDSLTEAQRIQRGIYEEEALALHNGLTNKWIKEGKKATLSDGRVFNVEHDRIWKDLDELLAREGLYTDIELAQRIDPTAEPPPV